MDGVLLAARSCVMAKGLVANSNNGSWAPTPPVPRLLDVYTDYVKLGAGGLVAPQLLLVTPYCAGSPGSNFSIRVYGWNHVGVDPVTMVWLPVWMVELACTACNASGPPAPVNAASVRLILDSENFCDTLAVVNGSLGPRGEVIATPGSDVPACFLVETRGVRYATFDFAQTDPVGMNALYAPC